MASGWRRATSTAIEAAREVLPFEHLLRRGPLAERCAGGARMLC